VTRGAVLAGDHPAVAEGQGHCPFPFHPLDLGEAALAELFGYQLEGFVDLSPIDPETIPLARYKRSRVASRLWPFGTRRRA
jgi:hypothetical protein